MKIKLLSAAVAMLTLAACDNSAPNAGSLKGVDFVSIAPGTNIVLSFAPEEMRVSGKVVNVYNGEYSIDGSAIKFGPLASTMMMGPMDAMQTEQDYFKFMDTVVSYELEEGKLTLKNDAGTEIIFEQVEELPADDAAVAPEGDLGRPAAM